MSHTSLPHVDPTKGQEHLHPPSQPKTFRLQDYVVFASVIVVFIGTLLPLVNRTGALRNFWTTTHLFFLGIGILLPLALGLLFLTRRLNNWEPRIGTLTLDQFASVVAVLSFSYFFLAVVTDPRGATLLSCLGAAGLLVATVFKHGLPAFQAENARFPHTSPAPAPHTNSQAPAPTADACAGAGENTDAKPTPQSSTSGAPVEHRAFWFAVERSRAVVDEHTGAVVHTIEPGCWFLALEDRGNSFRVQAPDGTIGLLHGTEGVERAPEN